MRQTGEAVLKMILGIVGAIFAVILMFWLCLYYNMNVRKTVRDTSFSPDGKYELTLMAVGEPEFPFGSARGRLLLKEGECKLSESNFELRNDGASINSSCWDVAWHEDYVEVILSGKEQFDQQILLYFDGRNNRKQLIADDKQLKSDKQSAQFSWE